MGLPLFTARRDQTRHRQAPHHSTHPVGLPLFTVRRDTTRTDHTRHRHPITAHILWDCPSSLQGEIRSDQTRHRHTITAHILWDCPSSHQGRIRPDQTPDHSTHPVGLPLWTSRRDQTRPDNPVLARTDLSAKTPAYSWQAHPLFAASRDSPFFAPRGTRLASGNRPQYLNPHSTHPARLSPLHSPLPHQTLEVLGACSD